MNQTPELAFNVLVKFAEGLWVAHCLELDIVATGETSDAAVADIKDLIKAQVSSALSNDNLDYLYHAAPIEVWREFALSQAKAPLIKKPNVPVSIEAFAETIFASPFDAPACHA